ncbi:MAG: hypothetical protein QXM43_07985 [Desulfurococcaceae archaeon]
MIILGIFCGKLESEIDGITSLTMYTRVLETPEGVDRLVIPIGGY